MLNVKQVLNIHELTFVKPLPATHERAFISFCISIIRLNTPKSLLILSNLSLTNEFTKITLFNDLMSV